MSCSKDNLYISPYLQSLGLGFSSNWQGVLDGLDIFPFMEGVEVRAKGSFGGCEPICAPVACYQQKDNFF